MNINPTCFTGHPQVVVVSADIAINARLQKQLNENDFSCRGFFDVRAAINWAGIHRHKDITYLLIPPFENFSIDEAINSFFENDRKINCIAFVDRGWLEKLERALTVYDSLVLLPYDEKSYEMLPVLLRQITRRIKAEKRVAELTGLEQTDEKLQATVPDELTDIQLRSLQRKQKQDDYLKKNIPEIKVNPAFFKNMGLEIRNPVNAIIGMAHKLEKSSLNEDQITFLNSIILSANNLLRFMDDMLCFANITFGKQELVYHTCNVRSMVDEVVELFRKQAEIKGIQLNSEVRKTVPESITADKLKIQQALNNLLAFAIDNTDQGGVDLLVDLVQDQKWEESLFFSVKDSGKGLKEEEVPLVFDSFFMQSYPEKEMYHVSGLGLSIVKSLVTLLGGKTEFDSIYGKGSHASFNIPLLSNVEASAEDQSTLYVFQKRGLKILLAEDDAINQMYLAGFLRSKGWEVDAVYNGIDALDLLKKSKYDLVVLDGQMPKMDGFETARKIRDIESKSAEKNIPILAISGYANPEDKERFFKSGMDAFLSKPVDEQELIRVIHKLTK